MKKMILCALFALVSLCVSAQDYKLNGKTFEKVKTEQTTTQSATKNDYKIKESDCKQYPIYSSKNGRAFIVKISKTKGEPYNKYLGEEISRQLCEEYGITYVEKN